MASITILTISLLFVTWCCLGSVQGSECYECQYINGIPEQDAIGFPDYDKNLFDKSCDINKKPNKKFQTTCYSNQTCGKMDVTGKHFNSGKEITMVHRGCIETIYRDSTNKCVKLSNSQNRIVNLIFAKIKLDFYAYMNVNEVTICPCDSDMCSTAASLFPTFFGLVTLFGIIFVSTKIMF